MSKAFTHRDQNGKCGNNGCRSTGTPYYFTRQSGTRCSDEPIATDSVACVDRRLPVSKPVKGREHVDDEKRRRRASGAWGLCRERPVGRISAYCPHVVNH